jgi:hypothetical protein
LQRKGLGHRAATGQRLAAEAGSRGLVAVGLPLLGGNASVERRSQAAKLSAVATRPMAAAARIRVCVMAIPSD